MEVGRGLTQGEINMLTQVFGDSIDYSRVTISNGTSLMMSPGVSIDGNIAIKDTLYHSDYSTLDPTSPVQLADQALFIHEMTHVWQSQNGYEVFDNGLGLQGIYQSGVVNPYSYDLDPNKSFRDYNMEQQASIIEDYAKKVLFNPNADLSNPDIDALSKLVDDFINSDKDGDWLPTLEAQLEPWRDFIGELLKNIPSGGNINDFLDTIPNELIPALLDGLQAALPGGILPYLFDLIPDEITSDVNDLWDKAIKWVMPHDPLVLDLDSDGIETISVSSNTHVLFDHNNDGIKTATGWVKSDDGLLVLDRNGNGTIDNGNELFGDQTTINGIKAKDGFSALSSEDTNGDGKFDTNDTNFSNVRVWRDMDGDVLLLVA